ncbi:MAG: MerR family transcriptional regulator [Thermoanaerobaculia bacterium]
MRIGELARQAGVNIQTIRFYERRQILRKPARTQSGYRIYDESDVESLRFVRECQRLGFTLTEVRELCPLHASIARPPAAGREGLRRVVELAKRKLGSIRTKIESLEEIEARLVAALRRLEGRPDPACPVSRRTAGIAKRS